MKKIAIIAAVLLFLLTVPSASAEWLGREGHTSVAMPDGSIVLMGGLADGVDSPNSLVLNDVWRSTDNGMTWEQQKSTQYSPQGLSQRYGHTSAVLPDGSIILLGGFSKGYRNDVWRSTDNGVTWKRQTTNAEWPGRTGHTTVAMPDGSIILMGGHSNFRNDVWRSTDNGVTWEQQTASAEWSKREDHTTVAMPDGSIVLMGGRGSVGDNSGYRNDVWRSTDNGVTWEQQTASAEWSKRAGHTTVAMPDGSIVLMGGSEISSSFFGSSKNSKSDVWRSTDNGVTWKQQTASAEWSKRTGHTTVAMPDGSIVLMGGSEIPSSFFGSSKKSDVWRSTDNGVTWTEQNPAPPAPDLFLPIGITLATGGLFIGVYSMMARIKREKTLKTAAVSEAKDLVSDAKNLALRGKFCDAIKLVDQALGLQPDDDELHQLRVQYVNLHAQYIKKECHKAIVEANNLASRGEFHDAIKTVNQALVLRPDNDELHEFQRLRAKYERDNARRPDLHISLETTPLRSGSWQQISATLTNPGSADALGIKIALSDDFEVRRVDTCTVEASGSKTIEIPLLPKHGGHVPLDITLTYEDPWSRQYSTSEEFWIDVNDITSFTHASRDTPVSPVSGFSPQPLTPKQFPTELADRYRDVSFIGKGGFGRVFRATRPDNTEVAVKIPLSLDEATGKSFIAELQSWTRLSHPNIVKLYDYNIMPIPYFEMEYCESALTDMEKPMAPREAAGIIFNICEGVKVAHNQRIIHRDLKPQNILIKNGVPKVSDWGLSRVVTESRTSTTTSFTAYYAAPEQINNTGKDERTDIWQIGVIFYELVTGLLPFTGESMVGVVSAIAMKNPQPPSEIVAESSDVESIILKCLEKKPDNRFQSILELQKELARYLDWNYSEELRNSISSGNSTQAAYYCGELVMTALRTGDVSSAYKYLSDLLIYTKGDLRVNAQSLTDKVQYMVKNDMEVSTAIIQEADLLIHQIRSRR